MNGNDPTRPVAPAYVTQQPHINMTMAPTGPGAALGRQGNGRRFGGGLMRSPTAVAQLSGPNPAANGMMHASGAVPPIAPTGQHPMMPPQMMPPQMSVPPMPQVQTAVPPAPMPPAAPVAAPAPMLNAEGHPIAPPQMQRPTVMPAMPAMPAAPPMPPMPQIPAMQPAPRPTSGLLQRAPGLDGPGAGMPQGFR